jgi:5'-nucleotidase
MSVVVLTNDDGIHAPGLAALEKALAELGDVYVVAPEREQSTCGHALTLHRPLRPHRLGERRFAVNGTPADCVNLAVLGFLPAPPVLIVSGINHGANLGDDVTYSGTIAAAMEGTLLDIPSIALSQLREGTVIKWHSAEKFAADVIRKLTSVEWPRGVLMNVNFPIVPPAEVTGVQFVRQGRRAAGIEIVPIKDPLNRPYLWIGDFLSDDAVRPDTDLAATRAGAISVTPLHLDLTHGATLAKLKKAFA